MSDFKLDPVTNDLLIIDGDYVLADTKEELARQRLSIVFKTFRGEWAFDIRFGIPYLVNKNNNIALLGKSSKSTLDLYIKSAILDEEFVQELVSYSSTLNRERRALKINAQVKVQSGVIIPVEDQIINFNTLA